MAYQSPLDYEFIRIPLPIQKRKKDLTHSAMVAYGYLAKMHFTNEDGYIRIVNKQVSKDLKLSEKTIKEAFNILSGFGLIHSKKMGRCKGYKLMPINPEGYPESIPDYERPKKSIPKFLDKEQPSKREVLYPYQDNRAPGGCYIPSTRGVLHTEHQRGAQSQNLPIIEELSQEPFKEMLPQGISFDSFFDNLPDGIAGKIQRKTIKDFWDKGFEDDLIGLSKSLASSPLDERILIFQGTLKIFGRKLQMKNEQIAIDESNAHKLDFVSAPDRLTGLSSVVGQSF